MAVPSRTSRAVVAALAASVLWASYYLFVLVLQPTSGPAAVLTWPFLFGGIAYLALAVAQGHRANLGPITREGAAYLRISLLAGMQVGVLASTYVAGAVDTSLLSLLGDVVLTPILVMVLLHQARDRARSAGFWGGVSIATAGSALTIVGGQSAPALHGWAYLVAPAVPLLVAFYFLVTARANIRMPATVVVAHATLGAAGICLLISPLLPGGSAGLGIASPTDAILLAGLGVTSFFLAPYLYFRAIEWAGLLLPALLMSTIPVFTLLLSEAAFRSAPAWLGVLGIPIAVVGSVLSLRGAHPGWAPSHGASPSSDGAGK